MKLEDQIVLELKDLKQHFESEYNVSVNKFNVLTSGGLIKIEYEVVGDTNSVMDILSSKYKAKAEYPKVYKIMFDAITKVLQKV